MEKQELKHLDKKNCEPLVADMVKNCPAAKCG